ncbi:MAG: NAD-dependent epimerase/dehydratase family protein [Actinomycetota bacterium]|nr:NAD-dependent epimerase/dehydratase family protein [Actinomycetota bacterium]
MDRPPNPLAADLNHILAQTGEIWGALRGGRVLITGGTGFFGHWMLESLLWANDQLSLGVEAVVLSRDPGRFGRQSPHLARREEVTLVAGDVCSFEFPEGPFTHVLHMAAETNTRLTNPAPSAYFDTAVCGTRRVLEFARSREVEQLLFTSSGAVYGPQPADCDRLSEDDAIAPPPESVAHAYGHGKRAAEFLCSAAHHETGLQTKIARCFAFVGPYLPLDSGYAIGDFIGSALRGDAIRLSGDGTPMRSYLYSADLASWLWTILLRGEPARPYNVGSYRSISILDLATLVAQVVDDSIRIEVAREPVAGGLRQRYVPDTARAVRELGLCVTIGLRDAVARTATWHRRIATTQEGA